MNPPVVDDVLVACGRPRGSITERGLVSVPLLAALRRAGTSHVYADTADTEELGSLVTTTEGPLLAEIDGSTANQPLIRKVVERYAEPEALAECARKLARREHSLPMGRLAVGLYTVVAGRIGTDIVRAYASGRPWEVSLQLHMALSADPRAAMRVGRLLRRMVPSAFVKVPFAPHAPHCLLVARDLEREGIPVNLTSTFSARQAVVAALLGDVTRTNVFMGRLSQGLETDLLGEHVTLEAQRALRRLRGELGVKTQLIVASMRDCETFERTAGCDAYTAPCSVIDAFLARPDVDPSGIESRLETSYADRLEPSARVREVLGDAGLARLWRVEPELVEFLADLRGARDWPDLEDGDELYRHFDAAGFADVFHAPSEAEWKALQRGKLPDLDAPLTREVAIDTLYSLLADADFAKIQEEIDAHLEQAARAIIADTAPSGAPR